ncbi:MAG: hypothetical protein NTU80_05555 [Verrucomicrobia bacterium]|nr:hypothetical protein [Verrucomicrobiota bacterium]
MAWRIEEPLIRGEIDNTTRGRVTGRLWFLGRDEPVVLNLTGNAWRDVAGHVLRFTNPAPVVAQPEVLNGLASEQRGAVGDITASRKVKVPDCSMEELLECVKAKRPFPWHWGNSVYLEWYSEQNGRVVIESAGYELELLGEPSWTMTEAEEAAQQETNGRAGLTFLNQLTGETEEVAANMEDAGFAGGGDPTDDDEPTSAGEAQADAEQARMDLLLDRVQARIARAQAAGETLDFERIMEEERARLRRERDEPEPDPATPEEEAARAEWIEEMNAAAEAALTEIGADTKNAEPGGEDEDWLADDEEMEHPLVTRSTLLTERVHADLKERGWLDDASSAEHPLWELANGTMIAGAKLAGAFGAAGDEETWPPEALFAGGVLVRLKKARGHLHDALAGLVAAEEQDLAEPVWLAEVHAEVTAILAELDGLIAEVRAVLEEADDAPGGSAGDGDNLK